MSKHTPGTWLWDEPENWLGLSARVFVREPYGMIAQVQISGWKPKSMALANARLIAAAPDLLAALEGVLRVADRATVEFDAARAAIKLAKGT